LDSTKPSCNPQLKSSETQESTASRGALNMFKQLLLPPKNRQSSTPASMESSHHLHESSLGDRYGYAEKVIGRGAGGVVRLFHKIGHSGPGEKLFAVKVSFL
jgi:hypothetical protein